MTGRLGGGGTTSPAGARRDRAAPGLGARDRCGDPLDDLSLTGRGVQRARAIQADIQACEHDLLAVLDEPARATLDAALARLTARVHDGARLTDWLTADADAGAPTGL